MDKCNKKDYNRFVKKYFNTTITYLQQNESGGHL